MQILIEQALICSHMEGNKIVVLTHSIYSWKVFLIKNEEKLFLRHFDSGAMFSYNGKDAYPQALEFATSLCVILGIPLAAIVRVEGRNTSSYIDFIKTAKKQKQDTIEKKKKELQDLMSA